MTEIVAAMGKTLAEMTTEVREVNVEKGWRTGGNTFGDYIALLHTEAAEALEAYRDYRLADVTGRPAGVFIDGTAKPEGVGSELADLLIRLLDTCDVFSIDIADADTGLADVSPFPSPMAAAVNVPAEPQTFGDFIAWLHQCISSMWSTRYAPLVLRALVTVAERYNIDLAAEFDRKVAYNRTRPYQHGGRTLSEVGRVAPAAAPTGDADG